MSGASVIDARQRTQGRGTTLRRLALRLAAVLVATVLVIPGGAAAWAEYGTAVPASVPLNVVAMPRDGAVDLSWEPPADDGGSPVLGYRIAIAVTFGSGVTHDIGDVTSYSFTGLTNGAPHRFWVWAVTAAGDGAETETIRVAPGSMPDVPPLVTVSPTGRRATSVELAWPADVDTATLGVRFFVVEQSVDGVTWEESHPIPGSTGVGTIGSLSVPEGTTHYLRVRAISGSALGPWSEAITWVHRWPPSDPIASVEGGPGRAKVQWKQPLRDGGSPITGYAVQVLVPGQGFRTVATTSVTKRSYVVTGLKDDTEHTLRVVAINAFGSSDGSYLEVVPRSAPSAPRVEVSPASGRAHVDWWPPESAPRPITSYVVIWYLPDGTWRTTVYPPTEYSIAVMGLQNGARYSFRVVARSAGGNTSSELVSVTPRTTPSAPSVSSSVGPGRVRVSWTAPDDGGAAIAGYAIQRFWGGAWRTVVQLPATARTHVFSGLPSSTTVTYRVVARNALGIGPWSKRIDVRTPGKPV